jgi:hypothetical protein|tara:strand:- start:1348 stop:2025 length:678 start_codon:yes stop_codon:yes gene_type:complete
MDHIQYSKNVLDAGTLNNLQQLCLEHYLEIPIYNFSRKTEKPKNYIEEVIRDLIGYENHVEYWVRDETYATLMHVDGNELQAKRDVFKYGEEDPHMIKEFPLNTHILYVNIDSKMEGGNLLLMPEQEYIPGRKILDTTFRVPEGARILVIKPETNHMVLFDKPLYHAVEDVVNKDEVKHRTALMFSSWDKIPSVYKEHEHWSNNMITDPGGPNYEPQPMDFRLTI